MQTSNEFFNNGCAGKNCTHCIKVNGRCPQDETSDESSEEVPS